MTSDAGDPSFATTRWTVVLAAGGDDPAAARRALETLCADYWFPLYAYARRRGADRHTAEDLVQSFFAEWIAKGWGAVADPSRGRFRAFLLTAFRRACADAHERAGALRRGGAVRHLPLDFESGERALHPAADAALEPDRVFERRWALTVLGRALERTRTEYAAANRSDAFEALVPFVGGQGDARPYAEIARRLGSTEGAVKVAVHRLRSRYREHLRAEIRDTVGDEAEIDEEIRHLAAAVR